MKVEFLNYMDLMKNISLKNIYKLFGGMKNGNSRRTINSTRNWMDKV